MNRHVALEPNHALTAAELHFRVGFWIEANVLNLALCEASARLSKSFQVSRSTAYRWLSAYKAAKGAA
jgi:hypothetical protein